MRVLGIDPGSRRTGWGVVQLEGTRLLPIDAGTIVVSAKLPLPERLRLIRERLQGVVESVTGAAGSEVITILGVMIDTSSFLPAQGQDNSDFQGLNDEDLTRAQFFAAVTPGVTVVQADAGAIGGSGSEEFMVTAETGEDAILYCDESGYAANVEKAESIYSKVEDDGEPVPMEKHSTPDVRTCEQLEEFFKLPHHRMAKTLIYKAQYQDREETVAVMIRGDKDINEVKLLNHLDALTVALADPETVKAAAGCEAGYVGPTTLKPGTRVVADETVRAMTNFAAGCGEAGKHAINVNHGRDFATPDFVDLRLARAWLYRELSRDT